MWKQSSRLMMLSFLDEASTTIQFESIILPVAQVIFYTKLFLFKPLNLKLALITYYLFNGQLTKVG